jgi:hypothetical protein
MDFVPSFVPILTVGFVIVAVALHQLDKRRKSRGERAATPSHDK